MASKWSFCSLYCDLLCVFSGKPRGLRTARKQKYLGTALKANPFGGASHAKGIVLEKV